MKKLVRVFAAVCAVLVLLSLAACKKNTQEVSVSPAPSAAETEKAEPTAEPTVKPTAEPTPAPENEDAAPTPAPEGDDGHYATLPAPEIGSDAFIYEFAGNPIDARYETEMEDAASASAMIDACSTAANNWKEQIDAVYMQILDSADEALAAKVKAEQETWISGQNDSLREIRSAVSEDDAMASVTVAENIMLYYRSRAIDLFAVLYEIDGQLVFG